MASCNAATYAFALSSAVLFAQFTNDTPRTGTTLLGLNSSIVETPGHLVVALGYNVCVDLIVPASAVINDTGTEQRGKFDHAFLNTATELDETFMHYFSVGAAAERSCNSLVFEQLVSRASLHPMARRNLGGNAALMGRKFSSLGAVVILGGRIGPDARRMLPPSVSFASSLSPYDEVHLIAEYSRGQLIGGVEASRANRFIVTSDLHVDIDAMIETIKAADQGRANVLIIAGLHMLEPMPDEIRVAALAKLVSSLKARSGTYPVHIELASSADAAWSAALARAIFPLADSVGFNEQEASFLYEALGGTWDGKARREDVAGQSPKAVTVASLLRFVAEAFPNLTRLHFHSLALHITTHKILAAHEGWRWLGGAQPVAAGSITASTEACRATVGELVDHDDRLYSTSARRFNVADPRLGVPHNIVRSESSTPVVAWAWLSGSGDKLQYHLAPVLACRTPLSTVGLGDAISAAGLIADIAVP